MGPEINSSRSAGRLDRTGRYADGQGVHNAYLTDDNGEGPDCYAGEDQRPENEDEDE